MFRIKGRKGGMANHPPWVERTFTPENIFCLNFKSKLKHYSKVRKSIGLVGRDL